MSWNKPGMNYVAIAIYKHRLKNISSDEAQQLCINVVSYQSKRLQQALMHALKETKPHLLWWYRKLIEAIK